VQGAMKKIQASGSQPSYSRDYDGNLPFIFTDLSTHLLAASGNANV